MPRSVTCSGMLATFALVILTAQTGALSALIERHQGARLGEEVIIPCSHHREANERGSFEWYYSRGGHTRGERIVHSDKTGILHRSRELWRGKKILSNFSLVVTNFRDEDQGVYSCTVCSATTNCAQRSVASLFLINDPPPAVRRRVYAAEGGAFAQPCPNGAGGSAPLVEWTFQRFGETSPSQWPRQGGDLQPSSTILIRDVRTADAGTYTCWRSTSSTRRQGVLSLSLCVLTATSVGSSRRPGSLLNCSVQCDMGEEPGGLPRVPGKPPGDAPIVLVTGAVTFRVSERYGTVACHAWAQGESERENSTLLPVTVRKENQEDDYVNQRMLLFCVSLASSFFTLAIFLGFVFLCRRRITAAFPEQSDDVLSSKRARDTKPKTGEAESQVIYSVIKIKRPEEDRVLVREEGCVYSTIQFSNEFGS